MSTPLKNRIKEMRKEKHDARKHPINVRHSDQADSSLTNFLEAPKPMSITCSDCGTSLDDKTVRWAITDKKKPYCRGCWLTRFGRSKQQEDEA